MGRRVEGILRMFNGQRKSHPKRGALYDIPVPIQRLLFPELCSAVYPASVFL